MNERETRGQVEDEKKETQNADNLMSIFVITRTFVHTFQMSGLCNGRRNH